DMKVVRTVADVRAELGGVIGLVPTMGALHDGHRSLFAAARAENDLVVASLFVNPTQFGDSTDLAAYPRDEARDVQVAEEEGVDVLFVPAADEIYPEGFRTWVEVEGAGAEGQARPGHFRGVATVCVKLFNIVQPQRAYFGQKDAEQAVVIRRVVRDLNMQIQIRVLPTIRSADGLALSSRNVLLSAGERERALGLPHALHAGTRAFSGGDDPVAAARASLNGLDPDYVELLDLDGAILLAAAVRVGSIRLIDNVILEGDLT
ncbi:MAG: pantoate--beta-alanine ligase, partial [Gaiellaceae bacterium]|nr:pantoate--beta-alanine ligase [Gaiellaceae bacterium]